MQKESVVTQFKVISQHLPGGNKETGKSSGTMSGPRALAFPNANVAQGRIVLLGVSCPRLANRCSSPQSAEISSEVTAISAAFAHGTVCVSREVPTAVCNTVIFLRFYAVPFGI
jgi:hypothetical protein